MFVDLNGDAMRQADEPYSVTDGRYVLPLAPGNYRVMRESPAPFLPTQPSDSTRDGVQVFPGTAEGPRMPRHLSESEGGQILLRYFLAEDFSHDATVNIGQPEIAACVPERKPFMIKA